MTLNPKVLFLFAVGVPAIAIAQPVPAIPEPGLAIYGTLADSNGLPYLPTGALNWVLQSGNSTVTVTSTVVCVNGSVWHVALIPFETRNLPGAQSFLASPNTFELTAITNDFTRSAWMESTPCSLPSPGLSQFVFSRRDRGRQDRVDLRVSVSAASTDTDGDGMHDWAELIAGTDPRDAKSILRLSAAVYPGTQGGIVIKWPSVAGRSYSVVRGTSLTAAFVPLATNIMADSELVTFCDTTDNGQGPRFYRITVNPR